MCYKKIRIRNNRFSDVNSVDADGVLYRSPSTQFLHEVPCGHCEACLQSKRDSYLLRSLVEYSRCSERALFCTLTYEDKYLPLYQWQDIPVFSDAVYTDSNDYCRPIGFEDESGNVLFSVGDIVVNDAQLLNEYELHNISSVWNKLHIQKFFKSLRERLHYEYGTRCLGLKRLVTIDGRRRISEEWKSYQSQKRNFLRYLVVCERGSDNLYMSDSGRVRRATSRPHYHVIIFIQDAFFSNDYVKSLVKDIWKYGNCKNLVIGDDVYSQKKYGRTEGKSIEYVTKYVAKDINDITENIIYRNHDDFLRYRSFVSSSRFYGADLFRDLTDKEIFNIEVNGYNIPSDNPEGRVIALPTYYSDKTGNFITHKTKVTEIREMRPFMDDGYYVHPLIHQNKYIYHEANCMDNPANLGYERVEVLKSKRYRTLRGEALLNALIDKRVKHYADIYNSVSSVGADSPYFSHLFFDVGFDEFINYVRYLYCSSDYHNEHVLCHSLYIHIQSVDAHLSEENHKLHKIKYRNNLYTAIYRKPKLFESHPL